MAATMEAAMFIMLNIHACVCARACMWGALTQFHPQNPSRGVPPQISKNAIRLE